jgi:hypothetical protein
MAPSPKGLGPENDCAGEGQQQLQMAYPLSSERMLYKDYDRRCSTERKNILTLSLKGLGAKTNCLAVNR